MRWAVRWRLWCPASARGAGRSQWRAYGYIHVPKKKPPHVLGPGYVWRKCFVVQPAPQTLDPLTKTQWLTRTCVVDGLPDTNTVLADDALVGELESRVSESLAFQEWEQPWRIKRKELACGVLQSALSCVWMLGHPPHLRESSLTFDPRVECYWRNDGHNFLCVAHPLYILHTARPLELFSSPDLAPGEAPPPFKYKPRHLRLFQRSFDQIVPFGGCKRYSPFSFAHTVFAEDQGNRGRDQLLAHGLLQLFAQTAGQTVQNGFPVGQDVRYPLAAQGVVTNGREFTFVCFQLNTLDFSGEGGRANVLWAGPTIPLYEQVKPGGGVEGFSHECARLLLQFLSHEPTRERPLESGFTLQLRAKREAVQRREERRREFREAEMARYQSTKT